MEIMFEYKISTITPTELENQIKEFLGEQFDTTIINDWVFVFNKNYSYWGYALPNSKVRTGLYAEYKATNDTWADINSVDFNNTHIRFYKNSNYIRLTALNNSNEEYYQGAFLLNHNCFISYTGVHMIKNSSSFESLSSLQSDNDLSIAPFINIHEDEEVLNLCKDIYIKTIGPSQRERKAVIYSLNGNKYVTIANNFLAKIE